jgi:predicted permease
MFAIADGILLRPLPVAGQDRLLLGWRADPNRGLDRLALTEDEITRFLARSRTLTTGTMIAATGAVLGAARVDDVVLYTKSIIVGARFFEVLGSSASLGRTLTPADDMTGAAPVVVISHRLWRGQFGGRTDVLGQTIQSNGRKHAVIGVMPPGFDLPNGVDLWLPLVNVVPAGSSRASFAYLALLGRLAPGATIADASGELGAFLREEESTHPLATMGVTPDVRSLTDVIVGNVRPLALVFTATAVLLLMLACSNACNLLIMRNASRGPEFAVRLAIGATRARVATQLLLESAIIGALALAAGMFAAWLLVRGFQSFAPADLPRLTSIRFDTRVIAAGFGAAFLSVGVCGIVPAWLLSQPAALETLRSGTTRQSDSAATRTAKRTIVIAQVALAQLVLVAAGLLINSWARLERIDLGFHPAGLTSARLGVGFQFADTAVYHRFLETAMDRIGAMPGVEGASIGAIRPLDGGQGWTYRFEVRGQSSPHAATHLGAIGDEIGAGFFHTLGVAIIEGREFTRLDLRSSVPVAIVNRSLARVVWPGHDPVGEQVRFIVDGQPTIWRTILGVVDDSRYHELRRAPPAIYVPYTQVDDHPFHLVIRSKAPLSAMTLQSTLRTLAAQVWVPEAAPFDAFLREAMIRPRLEAGILLVFALTALLLCIAGVYGVGAAFVRQRSRELGIRLALGATPSALLVGVLREGVTLTVIGSLLGLGFGAAVSRIMSATLYQVSPTDPATMFLVGGVMLGCSMLASWVPARRAASLDPARVLRSEA